LATSRLGWNIVWATVSCHDQKPDLIHDPTLTDDEEVVIGVAACSILLSSCIGVALTISENNKRKHKTWVNEYVAKR